jgi:ADP-L-glycero-D-manno-heptose 6-epimerase
MGKKIVLPVPEQHEHKIAEEKKLSKDEVRGIVQNKFKEENKQGEDISDEEQAKRTVAFQKMIIVTGGAGFIGSHLIKELNAQGREDILLVDDLSDPRKLQNINTLKFQDYVDKSKFQELLGFLAENKMIERIYHLGAESSRRNEDGKYLMENNYQYTCNIMDICYMHNIPLVFASSASVYGNQTMEKYDIPNMLFDDASDNYTPESYYALSKLQADRYSRKFASNDQATIIGLRYFNVVSEGEHEQHKDEGKSALCWMKEQYNNSGCVELYDGSKEMKRDFVHVNTAVWMTMNAMKKGRSGIYNIGTGTAMSFYDFAKDFAEIGETNIHFIPMPKAIAQGYQKFTQANMDNACFGITTRP